MLSIYAVIRSYAWDSTGRQLYVKTGSNAYYQITDPHGDNVAWASATALVATEHFDPWGNLTYTPSGTTTPFGFQGAAGSWTDSTTGFVSMGVRWYYPRLSEFLSSDPAAGTASSRTPIDRMRWLYGGDDPLVHVDPDGLMALVDAGGSRCDASCLKQVVRRNPQQAQQSSCDWRCRISNGWHALGAAATHTDPFGIQNDIVAAGSGLPGWARFDFKLAVGAAMYLDAGPTDRVTGDVSKLIQFEGDNLTDTASLAHSLITGKWSDAGEAFDRLHTRMEDGQSTLLTSLVPPDPITQASHEFSYASDVLQTWQTKGPEAAIDKVAYDFGYTVIGGGAEAGAVSGLSIVLGPEVVADTAVGGWRGTNMSAPESFAYHYAKHGEPAGLTEAEYDSAAQSWAAAPKGAGTPVGLADGSSGTRYRTPGGGPGGILDALGHIVSYWVR